MAETKLSYRSLAQLRRHGIDRLHDEWSVTGYDERKEGMVWYDSSHTWVTYLTERHNLTEACVAGIAASLSPRLPWHRAIALTEQMLDGGDISALALGAQVRKAQAILDGGDPYTTVSGNKVTAFFHNLMGEYDWVTVDKWSFEQVSGRDYNAGGAHFLERRGVYEMYASCFRDVARTVGTEPAKLQAILWIHTRGKG